MTEVSADTVINEERTFLHDISTPLMVLRLTLENLKASGAISSEYDEKYDRALRAVETLASKVEERRSHIKCIQGS
ncbi:MAG: hypothetical protein HRT45_19105 [Bdellovibrionales bacterium]|nr:hypothetical protein [Bdellovibrionales bacterium]